MEKIELNALKASNVWKTGEDSYLRLLRVTLIVSLYDKSCVQSLTHAVFPPLSIKLNRVM